MRLHTIASTLTSEIPLDQAYRIIVGTFIVGTLTAGLVVLVIVLLSRRGA